MLSYNSVNNTYVNYTHFDGNSFICEFMQIVVILKRIIVQKRAVEMLMKIYLP